MYAAYGHRPLRVPTNNLYVTPTTRASNFRLSYVVLSNTLTRYFTLRLATVATTGKTRPRKNNKHVLPVVTEAEGITNALKTFIAQTRFFFTDHKDSICTCIYSICNILLWLQRKFANVRVKVIFDNSNGKHLIFSASHT